MHCESKSALHPGAADLDVHLDLAWAPPLYFGVTAAFDSAKTPHAMLLS